MAGGSPAPITAIVAGEIGERATFYVQLTFNR
jgi:hypothetical protein